MTYNNTGVIGPQDGDIQIKLKPERRGGPTTTCASCASAPREFPACRSPSCRRHRQPILNFGAPAPIDIQVRGANAEGNFKYATSCCAASA